MATNLTGVDLTYDWVFSGNFASDVVTGTLDLAITFSGGGGLGAAKFDVTAR